MMEYTRLEQVRAMRPLIHCISNVVSANDCANLALAVGASPVMAHAPQEAAYITTQAQATVLNLGTPVEEKWTSCMACAQAAPPHPLVLDPVGVGARSWGRGWARRLQDTGAVTLLRVNAGEARGLLGLAGGGQGVDGPAATARAEGVALARTLAQVHRCAVLLTGEEDLIAGGGQVWRVGGGHPMMSRVTGTGCMLSVLCGVFAAVEPDGAQAALLAASYWKVCAQVAGEWAAHLGPGSFRLALLDGAGTLTPRSWAELAQVEQL